MEGVNIEAHGKLHSFNNWADAARWAFKQGFDRLPPDNLWQRLPAWCGERGFIFTVSSYAGRQDLQSQEARHFGLNCD